MNVRGVRTAAVLQTILTVIKTSSLALLIVIESPSADNTGAIREEEAVALRDNRANTADVGGNLPVFVDNAGPFGGVAGVTKTIPTGSLRHVDQNIKTAYSHIYGVSVTKDIAGLLTGSIEYNGSSGRNLYDLSDVNRRGMPLVYEGVGTATTRPNSQYTAFNTRGNRGRSQYHGVVFSADSRQFGDTGLALTSKYTVSNAKDNLSGTFSDADNNGYFNLGYLDPFNPAETSAATTTDEAVVLQLVS